VPRPSGPLLLVVAWGAGFDQPHTGELRGFRRATDRARRSGQGLTTVAMFLLVPQVKLRKRLDVAGARRALVWTAAGADPTAAAVGVPASKAALAWSFNRFGETAPGLVETRDARMGMNTEELRRQAIPSLVKATKPGQQGDQKRERPVTP